MLTPPLDGTILPGITRLSCLQLAADPAFHASITIPADDASTGVSGTTLHPAERRFTLSDLAHWSSTGALLEILCVGTAAIVAAAHEIGFEGRVVARCPAYPDDPDGLGLGPVGRALRARILGVQEGREEYQGWGVLCE